jgi:phasin
MDPMKPFEIPTDMRKFAEQSVDQARKAFDGFIAAAHQAVNEMEGRAHAARSGVMEMSGRAMTFAEKNMAESFEFAKSLVRAKDVEEVLRLQTDYVKKQIGVLQEQAKELADSASKAAKDVTSQKP